MTTATKPATKERPIIFSGPMVRAILEGRKTVTRRVMRTQPLPPVSRWVLDGDIWMPKGKSKAVEWQYITTWPMGVRCPYGNLGGRLWIRENWRTAKNLDDLNASQIAAKCLEMGYEKPWAPIEYQADGVRVNWDETWGEPGRLRMARFMPRWLSRCDLENAKVTAERLHDITEADALIDGGWTYAACPIHKSPVKSYAQLWDHINGKRAPWASNPWVFVISFKRINQ